MVIQSWEPPTEGSNDSAEDYFAEGMTDVLITELAKIRGLRVISRTSVKVYKGSKKSLSELHGG